MPPRFQAAPQLAVNDPAVTKERLRPAASPVGQRQVDTTAGTNLARLSQSLLGLASPLSQVGSVAQKKLVESAAVKGAELAAAAMQDIRLTGKAIKAGELATTDSPWVRYFAREQFGGLMAGKMSTDFAAHLQANPLDVTDPAAYDKAYGSYRAKWLADNIGPQDPAFATGFLKPAEDQAEAMRSRWVAQSAVKMKDQIDEGDYNVARHAATDWIANGTSVDLSVQRIIENNKAAILTRPNDGADIVRSTVLGIVDAAKRNPQHAKEILAMLDQIPAGSGKIGNISWVVEVVNDTLDKTMTLRSKAASEDARNERLQEKQATDDMYDAALAALDKADAEGLDPRTVDLTPFSMMAAEAGLNVRAVDAHLLTMVEQRHALAEVDDPDVVANLHAMAVAGSLRPGDLSSNRPYMTEATYKELRTFMKDAAAGKGSAGGRQGASYVRGIFNRPEVSSAISAVQGWFAASFGMNDANRRKGIDAKERFEWDLAQWALTKEGRQAIGSSDPTALLKWTLSESLKLTNRDAEAWFAGGSGAKADLRAMDWKKELAIPEHLLVALEGQFINLQTNPREELGYAQLTTVLSQYGLKITDAEKFLTTQRAFADAEKQ